MTNLVLVDTSIWVSHLRFGEKQLIEMLEEERVSCHPFVIGELACGTMKNRNEIITLLGALPTVKLTTDEELLVFIEKNKLMGKGLGLVDVHLLGSAIISENLLWTADKKLAGAAARLNVLIDQPY